LWNSVYFAEDKKIFIEGESRKIGKVSIPKKFFEKMLLGVKILIELPFDFRVEYTVETYKPHLFADEIKLSLVNIKKYIGTENLNKLMRYLENKNYYDFASLLIKKYYDILYEKSFPKSPDYLVRGDNLDDVYEQIKEIYSEIPNI
jgi:tRNA 2-selenouridine synthase